ncbi:hypothetical protein BC629DRAFT_1443366 [Irpex lacteus]|nr:hypothetical protein BC629DRAFT_1443366 [Irpex lacteus]
MGVGGLSSVRMSAGRLIRVCSGPVLDEDNKVNIKQLLDCLRFLRYKEELFQLYANKCLIKIVKSTSRVNWIVITKWPKEVTQQSISKDMKKHNMTSMYFDVKINQILLRNRDLPLAGLANHKSRNAELWEQVDEIDRDVVHMPSQISPVTKLSRKMTVNALGSPIPTYTRIKTEPGVGSTQPSGSAPASTQVPKEPAKNTREASPIKKLMPPVSALGPSIVLKNTEDVISNPANPKLRRLMCPHMVDTYCDPQAPPINTCGNQQLLTVQFGYTMELVDIMPDDLHFDLLKKLVTQPCFGRYLYNAARIDPKIIMEKNGHFNCIKNMTGSSHFNPSNLIGFLMYSTVNTSDLQYSIHCNTRTRDDRPLFNRFLTGHLLTTEHTRAMNTHGHVWVKDPLFVAGYIPALEFAMKPSTTPYPTDRATSGSRKKGSSVLTSPKGAVAMPLRALGTAESSGWGDMNMSVKPVKELEPLLKAGGIWSSDHYFSSHLRSSSAVNSNKSLDQYSLREAVERAGSEIPADSFVCIHYVPSVWEHKTTTARHEEVSWNMLRVVVLATPAAAKL